MNVARPKTRAEAYVAGLVRTDGSVERWSDSPTGYRVRISQAADRVELLELLAYRFDGKVRGPILHRSNGGQHYVLELYRCFPEQWKTEVLSGLPLDLAAAYWRGVVDGDGCFNEENGGTRLTLSLMGRVDELSTFYGWQIFCRVNGAEVRFRRRAGNLWISHVRGSTNEAARIGSILYADTAGLHVQSKRSLLEKWAGDLP